MCGAVALAPLAAVASSLFSGKSRGVQSYSPDEIELTPNTPDPTPEEPTLGVDNTDASGKKAAQGKNALVIKRNPGVTVAGSSGGSGLSVAGR